jgi:hypothetical protein
MTARVSLPPVLDPELAALRDLRTLADYAASRRRPKPVTTRAPHHVLVAAAIVMPAIEWAGRELMSRMPEFCEESWR